jgi:hypothetical protein
VALNTTLIPNTPTTIHAARAQAELHVHLVNDDPSQVIDVTVYRTYDDAASAAKVSEEQFTQIQPNEARVGSIKDVAGGVQLIFKAQASGAGNAPLRYWFSE